MKTEKAAAQASLWDPGVAKPPVASARLGAWEPEKWRVAPDWKELIDGFLTSASGLALLLMVTIFPILIGLGVSRLAATAAVASTLCFDWSPSDVGTILSAETAGLDPVIYWTDYQVPIVLVAFVVVGVLFYFSLLF